MNKRTFLLVIACIAVATALYFTVVAPPRIGTHSDDGIRNGPTEMWHASVTLWYLFEMAQDERMPVAIGTTPYSHYYARTYAVELWLVAALFSALYVRAQKRQIAKPS